MIEGLAQDLERILEAGNQAPSGENCQPWHFIVRGSEIEVHLLPERDQSAYSWGQCASYLANGAATENIVIASSKEGYRAEVSYFPNTSDKYHVATIALIKDPSVALDPLAKSLFDRTSNRKPFAKEPLNSEARGVLQSLATLIENQEQLDLLGRIGSTNEEVMLGNKQLHNFFFSHVNWTKEEDEKNKIGFYIKTLELPPPAQAMFKVFKNWSTMRFLAALGFAKVVAKQNGATNASAGAFAGFTVSDLEPASFVKLGREVERFWLTVTSLGLSLQPLTGVLFFRLKIDNEPDAAFSPREQKLIAEAYKKAREIFSGGQHLAFMCRIGRAEPPSARAIRFPIVDAVTVRNDS